MKNGQGFVGLGLLGVWLLSQSSCFYYAGAETYRVRRTTGKGFFYAVERHGHWDTDGPPPQVGAITDHPLYRRLNQASTVSTEGSSTAYEVSDMYPLGRYLITSIREIGATREGRDTVHYYEVELESGNGGFN